jgi:thiol-disulfide isomerase/thioredoxin
MFHSFRSGRFIAFAAVALSASLCLIASGHASHVPAVGDVAPVYLGNGIDGKKVSLEDYKGKVVVISFWATWCSPCRQELPVLERIQIAGKGQIQVVAINIESRDIFHSATKILKDATMKLTNNSNQRGYADYGVKGIPHFVVIGKDMRIVSIREGYGPGELDAVAAELNAALRAGTAQSAGNTAETPPEQSDNSN